MISLSRLTFALWFSALALAGPSGFSQDPDEKSKKMAGSDQVAEIINNYKGRGTLSDGSEPTPVAKSLKEFRIRDGFEIEAMAAEPNVAQPLSMTWDSRGRLWVSEYLQYQFPAGLKIVEYDNHLRARFDKVPPPPPHGARGIDRVTVFEDTDGDGTLDYHKAVISDLNISTSVAIGAGGIWAANPPYLLFYPDKNGDDSPDSDPEVVLSGFGIEDTHSVMNSLEWGPDGWLYGVNGSTTTGKVKNPANGETVAWQGQMVWRYHPIEKHFEIYGEGGGNTFSLEIDAKGRVFSGTNNGDTRGMHYPQGSYGKKGWGKHGPLTNPYAFGYFNHMPHEGDKNRFAQAFCIYEGGVYPKSFEGKIIAPNSLHNLVWVSERLRDGSGYKTVDEENLVETDDRWFRPVFGGVGPDGCVYIGDWYDTRLSHVRPIDDWHKESGRVYRVKPEASNPKYTHGDLSKRPASELVGLFKEENRWVRRRAVLELGWRQEKSVIPVLTEKVDSASAQEALESLWALNLLGGLSDELATKWLGHKDADVRRWVVRLIGDRRSASETLAKALVDISRSEPEVQVRVQLAAAAKRLPSEIALPVIEALCNRDEDLEDKNQPLMVWWAVEAHSEKGRRHVADWTSHVETWEEPMFQEIIAGRLMKRYAMAGGDENLKSCGLLLRQASDDKTKAMLLESMQAAFEGAPTPELPNELSKALSEYSEKLGESGLVIRLKNGETAAIPEAQKAVMNKTLPTGVRTELIRQLGATGDAKVVSTLLGVLALDQSSALKRVALQSLARFDDVKVAKGILGRYGSTLPAEHGVRSTAERVLASRPEWAKLMLEHVDKAIIKSRDVSPDVVQLMLEHGDSGIEYHAAQHWPGIVAGSAGIDLGEETKRIKEVLAAGKGDASNGEVIFSARCATCHKLFGKGLEIGPDLTGYERQNPDFWIPAMVNPSLELREGYINYVATMKDGRVLSGVMVDQSPQTVKLKDLAAQVQTLGRGDIESLEASKISLMPPALLVGIGDDDLRDLFAYMMKKLK